MDARDIIEDAASHPGAYCGPQTLTESITQWQGRAILAALAKYDCQIIRRDENHGPTRDWAGVERLLAVCQALVDSYDSRRGVYALGEPHQTRESARSAIRAIRAMEVKHG